jgi:hypothetical protein
MYRRALLFAIVICLSSCGYRAGHSSLDGVSISIPYVKGDDTGIFTSSLVSTFASSNTFSYVHQDGDYDLLVEILAKNTEELGYRHDHHESGGTKKNITESEGRDRVQVQVSLKDNRSGKVIFGPSVFEGFVDYDYIDQKSARDLAFVDSRGVPRSVLSFSLGQLEPISSAQEASLHPLYRDVSQKIVDAISAEW